MNFSDAIDNLNSTYQILGIVRLSDFFQKNGDKKIHNALLSLYQPCYQPNDKILVLQDCFDAYDYPDMPGRAITALQKSASAVDISNCFITVISPNPGLGHELEQARMFYSSSPDPMQHVIIDGEYQVDWSIKHDTFCILPWMHLYVSPNGDVLPCCQGNQDFPLGNIKETSIADIMASEPATKMRSMMMAGTRNKECSRCWELEKSGLPSSRIVHNQRWQNLDLPFSSTGHLENFKPIYLDIRLSNICNLKCRMCSSYYSSAIAEENQRIYGGFVETISKSNRKHTLAEITEYLPHCEKIYFAGGEPLLSSEHYEILENLICIGNVDLEVCYNTNFSTLTYRHIDVTDLWQHFSNIKVGASIDAMGQVAEYVRHGTNWTQIEKNLEYLRSKCNVDFSVTSTVGLMNLASLIDLQKHWHTSNILEINKFSLTVMISPPFLTVRVLPSHHKDRLSGKITEHIHWCRDRGADQLASQWEDVITYMTGQDDSYLLPEFKKITSELDQHRQECFKLTFPEYKDIA